MSVAELKKIVDEISADDRLFLEHYLAHLRRINDPENAADLERRWEDIEAGKKVTLEEAIRIHEERKAGDE